jgi:hypothetical protein
MAERPVTCHRKAAMVTCAELTAYWDQAIGRFLVGGPAVPPDPRMRSWFEAYRGRGRGEVNLNALPEPYQGRWTADPSVCSSRSTPARRTWTSSLGVHGTAIDGRLVAGGRIRPGVCAESRWLVSGCRGSPPAVSGTKPSSRTCGGCQGNQSAPFPRSTACSECAPNLGRAFVACPWACSGHGALPTITQLGLSNPGEIQRNQHGCRDRPAR